MHNSDISCREKAEVCLIDALHMFSCHRPRRRAIQYTAAHRFNHQSLEYWGCPVKPGNDGGRMRRALYLARLSRHGIFSALAKVAPTGQKKRWNKQEEKRQRRTS